MEDSLNLSGFRPLLKFASKLDNDLETHFETCKEFLGVSPTIQNKSYFKWAGENPAGWQKKLIAQT